MPDNVADGVLSDFFQEREILAKKVKVVIKPMTQEQARQLFPYRPFSKYAESRWGGDTLYDDVCMVINGLATRCKMCRAPTKNQYLENGVCPDRDGRSEFLGYDPHRK